MKFNTTAKDMIVAPKKLFSDDEEDISEESDSDSEEQAVVTDPKQIIAQHEQLEKEAAQLAQKYRQQRRKSSVGGTPKQQAQSKKAKKAVELSPDQVFSPTSLYEPIRGLESEIARNCQVRSSTIRIHPIYTNYNDSRCYLSSARHLKKRINHCGC